MNQAGMKSQFQQILETVPLGVEGLKELINVHPLFVHFPIALLLGSALFYFLGVIFKRDSLIASGKWTLLFGTLSAGLAVWTGLRAAQTVSHGGYIHFILLLHQYLGFSILALGVLLSIWVLLSKANMPAKGKVFFLTGLVLLSVLIVQGSDLGGRMVFLNGVGVGKKSMMEKAETEGHAHSDQEKAEGTEDEHHTH